MGSLLHLRACAGTKNRIEEEDEEEDEDEERITGRIRNLRFEISKGLTRDFSVT
jgi:hypothetical protein